MPFPTLRDKIEMTPFIDTHEHLLEERTRLRGAGAHRMLPCTDAALLFHHYAADDLRSAGMPPDVHQRFFSPEIGPTEKWSLFLPFWQRCRHTGYMQAVERTIQLLFGEHDLDAATFTRISDRMRDFARPGFYRDVLARAGIESCQVNSLEESLCETEQPDILLQDLSITAFTTSLDLAALERRTGIRARTLEEIEAIADWHFDHAAGRAVAVKSQAAYQRRLDYEAVPRAVVAPLFARFAAGDEISVAERKAIEDYLMRRTIGMAGAHGLPVKLHCGYYAGTGHMPLGRVRQNAADLCPLLSDYPDVSFVLMHIGYPYQDEYIALAKQYPNVYVDLCWAWIIDPVATVRFLAEFLVAAPASKLFTFGGDYANVEPIVGHAAIARQGIVQALGMLVDGRWLSLAGAFELVDQFMHENARRLFKLPAKADATLPSMSAIIGR